MDDKRFSRRRILALAGGTLSTAVAGCLDAAPETTRPSTNESGASTNETADPPQSDPPGEFPENLEAPPEDDDPVPTDSETAEVFQEVADSVVGVRIQRGSERGAGTAWVYEDDYLVTNEHVVAAGDGSPFVWFTDIGWRKASVVGTDVFSDLAVLEVEGKPEAATPLEIVDSPPPVGTEIVAIGNPFDLTGSFTTGIISGRDRNIPDPDRPFSIADGVQTDAALNPGNSGGPILTLDSEVAGVVRSGVGDNIGFAISAAMVEVVVPSLIDDGTHEHSFMGVALEDVTPEIIRANELSVGWGAYIDQVLDGYPVASVLQGSTGQTVVNGQETPVGGDVVVRIEDWTIPTSERLSAYLSLETSPGDEIEVELVRDGRREVVDVELVAREDAP